MPETLNGPSAPLRAGGTAASIFAAYLALAVVATYPLAVEGRDHVFGEGTPPLNVWAMGWVLHQLPRDPLRLFDANAFYPYGKTLALSEHLFVPALLGAPVVLLTGNLVLAHNVVALLTLALAGLGMYLLAKELTGDVAASFAAGVLYAFHTWNVNELIRIQILSNQWFPFVVLSLLRYFARPSWRRALGVGAFYALESLSCMYWALYLPLLVAAVALFLEWRLRLPWRSLRPLAASLAAALLLSGLFALPYVETARAFGFEREEPPSVPIDRYFDVLPENLLYAGLLGTARPNQNAAHFPGFLALALAALGLAGRRASGERAAALVPLFAGLVAAGFLLSLGPRVEWGTRALGPGPYALLRSLVPGFRNVRYPERFSVFFVLGLAPLLALGVARLRPRVGPRAALLFSALVFIEHLSAPRPLVFLPAADQVPSVYRWLAGRGDVRAVAEVPASAYAGEREDALPMYLSTVHWKRTLQGFTGYFPPTYNFVKWRLFHFPSRESVSFLSRFGADTIVVHPEEGRLPAWAAPDPRWEVVGPFAEGQVVLRLKGAGLQRYAPPADDGAGLSEIDRNGWQVQASRRGAEKAVDGAAATAWGGKRTQASEDFYRIRLRGMAAVARISLTLPPTYVFPTQVELRGKAHGEDWEPIRFDAEAAYDRLFAWLLYRPREARLDIDIAPRPLGAVELRLGWTDPFWMPWAIPEIRLYERR